VAYASRSGKTAAAKSYIPPGSVRIATMISPARSTTKDDTALPLAL